MSITSVIAINVVLDLGIVIAILSVLRWGMRAQVRDMQAERFLGRRLGHDRRQAPRAVPVHADRRREQRRERGPLTA